MHSGCSSPRVSAQEEACGRRIQTYPETILESFDLSLDFLVHFGIVNN